MKIKMKKDTNASVPPAINGTRSEAICWAFSGVVGGAGVTSLAIQMAHELVQTPSVMTRKPPSVCLIDLDFENGACAHYLDLKPAMQLSDLQGDPARIDRNLVEALTVTHKCGVNLIASPNSLRGNQDVNPNAVLAVLDQACQIYDYVIMDVPRLWQPWTHAAIAAANRFGLVLELTIPALHMTRTRLDAFETEAELCAPVDIILNKHERRSFRSSLRVSDAEQTLGRAVFAKIGLDSDVVREAINWGIPAGTARSDSRFAKDCRALTELWIEQMDFQKSA